ncbi:MAG: class I SAM-dependent methyltransferase [Chloroflexi bacterium]|nr:class I SAM-dependent methyltransferase [Chloroflexota bacterium]
MIIATVVSRSVKMGSGFHRSFRFPRNIEMIPKLFNTAERAAKARQFQCALSAARLWHPPRKILDVGCGTGLLLANLDVPLRTCRVGCDVRAELYAHAGARNTGIDFIQANVNELPFSHTSFDLVVCMAVMEELANWQDALAIMAYCVRPGGVLYVTMTNGKMLSQLYPLLARTGIKRNAAEWSYVHSSLRFDERQARYGFGLNELHSWRYVDVTPYLMRANLSFLRAVPVTLLAYTARLIAPSFGHAWIKHPA